MAFKTVKLPQTHSSQSKTDVTVLLGPHNYSWWKIQAETKIAIKGLSKHLTFETYNEYANASLTPTPRRVRYLRAELIILQKKLSIPEEDKEIQALQKEFNESSQWEQNQEKAELLWILEEEQLIGILRATIEPHFWTNLKTLKSAAAIWKQLKKETHQDEAGNLMALLCTFFNMTYQDGEPLTTYVARVESVVDQVVDLGKTLLTPEIVCYRILSSLPPRFDAIQQAIFQLPVKTITLALIKSRFASEDSRTEASRNQQTNQERTYQATTVRECSTCKKPLKPTTRDYYLRCSDCQVKWNTDKKPQDKVNSVFTF